MQRIETRIAGNDAAGHIDIEIGKRVHGFGQHFLRKPTHFGDAMAERLELPVVSFDDMFRHDGIPSPARRQPKRPVM